MPTPPPCEGLQLCVEPQRTLQLRLQPHSPLRRPRCTAHVVRLLVARGAWTGDAPCPNGEKSASVGPLWLITGAGGAGRRGAVGGFSSVRHPWSYLAHCVVRQCCIIRRAGLSSRGARHRRHGVLVRHLLLKRTPLVSLSGRRRICRAPMPAGRSCLAWQVGLLS